MRDSRFHNVMFNGKLNGLIAQELNNALDDALLTIYSIVCQCCGLCTVSSWGSCSARTRVREEIGFTAAIMHRCTSRSVSVVFILRRQSDITHIVRFIGCESVQLSR